MWGCCLCFLNVQRGFDINLKNHYKQHLQLLRMEKQSNDEAAIGGILDISPRGIKMFSSVDLSAGKAICPQLEIRFILDSLTIVAYGEVMWSRPYRNGKQYGIFFQ